jgi:hypothetical protein
MKKLYSTLFLALGLAATSQAQNARIQVIHNSPDPAASVVDIWANNDLLLDDVPFRAASEFLTVPAGTPIVIGVAVDTSTVASSAIAQFTVTFEEDSTYIISADGMIGSMGYNPATPFNLELTNKGREAATMMNQIDLMVHHGATDAPTVDVVAEDTTTILVDDAPYAAFSDYLSLADQDYIIRVTTADNSTIVESYTAPLNTLGLAGEAITVVASGFLDPSMNNGGPAFGLWVAQASGGAMVELPVVTISNVNKAPVQVLDINMFPNPTTDFLTLDFDLNSASDIQLQMIDAAGRIVKKEVMGSLPFGRHNRTLDVSDLSTGVYYMTVWVGNTPYTQAVQINR